jgi:hypothetical protein
LGSSPKSAMVSSVAWRSRLKPSPFCAMIPTSGRRSWPADRFGACQRARRPLHMSLRQAQRHDQALHSDGASFCGNGALLRNVALCMNYGRKYGVRRSVCSLDVRAGQLAKRRKRQLGPLRKRFRRVRRLQDRDGRFFLTQKGENGLLRHSTPIRRPALITYEARVDELRNFEDDKHCPETSRSD